MVLRGKEERAQGEGWLKCWGGWRGMGRRLQHVQREVQPLGSLRDLCPTTSACLQTERSEGKDKLFQVSPGQQGRERVTGTVATATSPWKPDT